MNWVDWMNLITVIVNNVKSVAIVIACWYGVKWLKKKTSK